MSDTTDRAEPPDDELDPGGMPDDEIDEEPSDDEGARGLVYDSGKRLRERGVGYPGAPPPGMRALKAYVQGRWGGDNLGILSQPPRDMRGGSNPSLHNWGIAYDWGYVKAGRAAAEEVIAWCLQHSERLGIQGVHDYVTSRYWKSYAGWKNAKPSAASGFGQPSSKWLHIERTWDFANDARPIDQLLAGVADKAAPPGAAPTANLGRGDKGPAVVALQDFLRANGFADFTTSDGDFGARTEAAVRRAQEAFAAKGLYPAGSVDGQWGPKSQAAAAQYRSSVAPSPPPSAAKRLPGGPLRLGAKGPAVVALQDFLRANGFADFTNSDGQYGPRTEAAVRKAQQAFAAKGLYPADGVDGMWGPKSKLAGEQFG